MVLKLLSRLQRECENHFSEVPNRSYSKDYSCTELSEVFDTIRAALKAYKVKPLAGAWRNRMIDLFYAVNYVTGEIKTFISEEYYLGFTDTLDDYYRHDWMPYTEWEKQK